jgi:hypothetical protein
VTEIRDKTAVLKTLKDYTHLKNAVWGVTSRNREQNFALNLLMDPEIDFVTLAGTAGTGKTLMALASGLTQVLDDRRYTEIIMTRATVSVGEDIGFLPGTEEEKMGPWMGALDDNLEFLAKGDGGNAGEWGRAATNELIRSRIKIKSMNFMRGRTFMNKYVIIDEAQNLTPKQMKTLITRAGPGTKIICMGNLAQIDTPYLTEGSSGLTFAVDRFKGWPHGGHITLARGERSRLADFASEVLVKTALATGAPKAKPAARPRPGCASAACQRGKGQVIAAARQTFEPGQHVQERQLDGAGGAVALLADDDLGHAGLLAGVLGVVLVAVDEHDDVGILLDGARFAQVAHHGALVGARAPRERLSCDSAITGHCNSLASIFRPREISPSSVARLSPSLAAAHELQVVDHDQAQLAALARQRRALARSSLGSGPASRRCAATRCAASRWLRSGAATRRRSACRCAGGSG